MLIDTLLPNRAWNRRVRDSGKNRLIYWLLRIALAAAVIFLIVHFGIRQHQELR